MAWCHLFPCDLSDLPLWVTLNSLLFLRLLTRPSKGFDCGAPLSRPALITQVFEVCSSFTSLRGILNCSIKYCNLPPLAFCSPNSFYPCMLSLFFVHSAYYFQIHKWITHFTGVMIVVCVCLQNIIPSREVIFVRVVTWFIPNIWNSVFLVGTAVTVLIDWLA